MCSKVNEFASEMAGLNVEFLEAHSLEKLLKSVSRLQPVLSGLETRILSQIETLAGDAEDTAQRVSKSSKTASRTKARRAKASTELPNTSKALDRGQITTEQFDQLAAAASKTSAEDVDNDANLRASVSATDGDGSRTVIAKWVDHKQTDNQRLSARQRQIANRTGSCGRDRRTGMYWWNMTGDPTTLGPFVRRAQTEYERLYRADGGRDNPNPWRTDQQRRYDAQLNVLNNLDGIIDPHTTTAHPTNNPTPQPTNTGRPATDTPKPPVSPMSSLVRPEPPIRAHIVVTTPLGLLDGTDPDATARITGDNPIVRSQLEELMCNAHMYGMLYDPRNGDPLWLSRSVRTATPGQWIALLARDHHCVLCGTDAIYCEAHHLTPVTAPNQGETNIDQLALLCKGGCHTWLHTNNRTLYQRDDGTWATRPATPAETPTRKPGKSAKSRVATEPASPEQTDRQPPTKPETRPPPTSDTQHPSQRQFNFESYL